MPDQSVTVRLRADVAAYKAAMLEATRSTDAMSKAGQAQLNRLGGGFQRVGRNLTKFVSVPIAAVGAAATFAAVQWESSWAGVTKTVDGTAKQMSSLEQGLRGMAKELPATHGEIAKVAEAAGQLGIQTPRVLGFTRTMVDLGETTDLTADQAASALARLANITQMPQTEFDRLGATVVDLGNKSASTESEIVDMSLGLAAAGAQIGLTEADILAFSATLSSVGIEAEAGGSSMSRVFTTMGDAVQDQTAKLETFAKVAGVSVDEFSAKFRDDAAGAIALFIEGLGQMTARGESVTKVLDELGFSDIRVTRALKSVAGAGDLVNRMLDTGGEAWRKNTALTDEAAKRYDTTAAELEKLRNKAVDLGINVGGQLVPVLSSLVSGGEDVIGFLDGVSPGFTQAAITAGLFVAAVGPLTHLAGTMVRNLESIATAARLAGSGIGFLVANPVIAGVAAVGAGLLYLHQRANALADSFTTSGGAAEALAASTGLTLAALDDLSDGADKAGRKTEAAFTELNAKAIKTLRDLDSQFDTDAFLLEIGYEMVARGAKPEQVIAHIERLAAAAGVEVPVNLDARTLKDFDTQVETVAVNTTRLAQRIAQEWQTGTSAMSSAAQRDMTEISEAVSLAFRMDDVKGGVALLMEAESAMKEAGLGGWQLRNAMQVLFNEFKASAGIEGIDGENFDRMRDAVARLTGAESSLSAKHKAVIADLVNTGPVAQATEIMGGWASAVDKGAGRLGRLAAESGKAKGAADGHAGSLKAQGDAAGYTAGQIDKVTSALQENFDVLRGGLDAEIQYQQALDDLSAAFENENGKITANSRAFDLHTQSGRDNATAMRDVGNAIVGLMSRHVEQGGTLEGAIAVGDMYVANLKDQMRQAGHTDAEIDMLVAAYGLVPKDVATNLKVKGLPEETTKVDEHGKKLDETDGKVAHTAVTADTAGAFAAVTTLKAALDAIQSKTITVTTVAQTVGGAPGGVHAMPRAGGGPVGPGQLYLVGEEGPELVQFSTAGLVHSAGDTSRMLKGAGDGGQRVGMSIGEGLGDGLALGLLRGIPKAEGSMASMSTSLLDQMATLAAQLQDAAEEAVSDAWGQVTTREARRSSARALRQSENEVTRTRKRLADARADERRAERRVASLSTPITDTRLDGRIATTKRMLARARRTGDSDLALNAAWDLGALRDRRGEILASKNEARRGRLRDAKADRRAAREDVRSLEDQLKAAKTAVTDAARSFVEQNTHMIDGSRKARHEWRLLARQAGLTAGEIDRIVAAYRDLDRIQRVTRPVERAAGKRGQLADAVAAIFARVGADLDTNLAARLARGLHSGRLDRGDVRERAVEERERQERKRRREQQAKARAAGGPVRAGLTYLVGERGAELFRPDRDGRIIPHTQTGAFLAAGHGGGAGLAQVVERLDRLNARVEAIRPIVVNQGPVTDSTARDIAVRGARQIAFAQVTSGE